MATPKTKPLTSRQIAHKIVKQQPMPPLIELKKDLRAAAKTLSSTEVRYLVDQYYAIQDYRKAAGNQVIAMDKAGEPASLIAWIFCNMDRLEDEIRQWLDIYTESEPLHVGQWLKSITGIGPVISAGLLAHIDIVKAPTVSHIWRFAGLDPNLKWLGAEGARKLLGTVVDGTYFDSPDYEGEEAYALDEKQLAELDEVLGSGTSVLNSRQLMAVSKLSNRAFGNLLRNGKDDKGNITRASMLRFLAKRPWNANLKKLCFLVGESFVKTCHLDKSFYGPLYIQRKAQEEFKNNAGEFADQAAAALKAKNYSKDTEAYKAYSNGRLPQAQIHRRACRWVVKIFLSHFHDRMYRARFGEAPPKPFTIEHLGHAHYIAPPD